MYVCISMKYKVGPKPRLCVNALRIRTSSSLSTSTASMLLKATPTDDDGSSSGECDVAMSNHIWLSSCLLTSSIASFHPCHFRGGCQEEETKKSSLTCGAPSRGGG